MPLKKSEVIDKKHSKRGMSDDEFNGSSDDGFNIKPDSMYHVNSESMYQQFINAYCDNNVIEQGNFDEMFCCK